MLRRTKRGLQERGAWDGASLPPMEARTVECPMSGSERRFYDALWTRSKAEFEGFEAGVASDRASSRAARRAAPPGGLPATEANE